MNKQIEKAIEIGLKIGTVRIRIEMGVEWSI